MIKQKLIILFIAVCSIWNSAKARSYLVESFEGQKVKIYLTERSTAMSRYSATVSCLTDSLFLVDYNDVKEVHVLNHKFLEIVYDTRGGSGSRFGNTLILTLKDNKINVAIVVNSFGEAFGGDLDGSLYTVKFTLTGNDKSNFKLIAHVYDRHRSNSSPSKSYVKKNNMILNFDPVQTIFYSTHKSLIGSFNIDAPKTQRSKKEQINGSLPFIALNPNYYYYKSDWYKSGNDHDLIKEYYR